MADYYMLLLTFQWQELRNTVTCFHFSGNAKFILEHENYSMSSAAATLKSDRETIPTTAKTEVMEDLCGYGNETFAYTCRFVLCYT
jgi:hypothetical protein